jgi:hypothetical protein
MVAFDGLNAGFFIGAEDIMEWFAPLPKHP